MDNQQEAAVYLTDELQNQQILFANTEAYTWPQAAYYPALVLPEQFTPAHQEMQSQGDLSHRGLGEGLIRENGNDNAIGQSFGHIVISGADEQPSWRIHPPPSPWPHAHSDGIEMYRYREREERAKTFDDDEEFVPGLLTPDPPIRHDASLAVNGTGAVASSSSPSPPGTSRSRGSKAMFVKGPEDGTVVRSPANAPSSLLPANTARGRLSKAITIMRPDGTVVTPPSLGRKATSIKD